MIQTELNGCVLTILPIIKGLRSEYDRVKAMIDDTFDCVAVTLSIEDIEIFTSMDLSDMEYDPSEYDAVYAHFLKQFGEVDVPVPAFKAVIDRCNELGVKPIPLEMCDEEFTKEYCEHIKIWDMLKEKRLLRKAIKNGFDMTSPEIFVEEWDALSMSIKGHRILTLKREENIAKELATLTGQKKTILAVIEYERVDGVLQILEAQT
jgi:hypothetical protein